MNTLVYVKFLFSIWISTILKKKVFILLNVERKTRVNETEERKKTSGHFLCTCQNENTFKMQSVCEKILKINSDKLFTKKEKSVENIKNINKNVKWFFFCLSTSSTINYFLSIEPNVFSFFHCFHTVWF